MPYHFPQLDELFRNDIENTNSAIRFAKFYDFSEWLFNRRELEKTFNMWNERFFSSFPTPYYLPHSVKLFKNAIENTIHIFCMKKIWFSKLLLNRLHFAKILTWVMILMSIAFQRYIKSPIWAMLAEVQPRIRGSSGQTTQAVKLQ